MWPPENILLFPQKVFLIQTISNSIFLSGIVANVCNLSTRETEAGRYWVHCQTGQQQCDYLQKQKTTTKKMQMLFFFLWKGSYLTIWSWLQRKTFLSWDRVSLCSGWPHTHGYSPASASWILWWLQACTNTPGLKDIFNTLEHYLKEGKSTSCF